MLRSYNSMQLQKELIKKTQLRFTKVCNPEEGQMCNPKKFNPGEFGAKS